MSARFELHLPAAQTLVDTSSVTTELLLGIEQRVRAGDCREGYLLVERETYSDLMIFFSGAVHSAVRFKQAGANPLPLAAFFADLQQTPPRRLRLCRTDSGFVLLAAVVFQNEPAVKSTADVTDLDQLLTGVAARQPLAAILLTRGMERVLCFCRDGTPVAAYFGDAATAPKEQTVREQLLAYTYAAPADTLIEIYDNLDSKRDEHADHDFKDLLAGHLGPPPFLLTVTLAGERVERRLIKSGKAEVGREPDNDIVLDDRSVSRHHCIFEWSDSGLVVRDAGSANGTFVDGVRAEKTILAPGTRVVVGDFEILFGEEAEVAVDHQLQTIFLEEVIDADGVPQLLYKGRAIKIEGTVFTIGKASDANLRLKGLWMKPIQATLVRQPDGKYQVLPVGGGKPVRLNGALVPTSGLQLYTGALLEIGKHKLIFVSTDRERS